MKKTRHNCNQKAKELFQDYCQHFQVDPKDFKGVELTDFPQLEKFFETQLFAMVLKEDGTAKTLYLSQSSFPTKIYLNVFKNHLSLITDIQMYSKQYICNGCEKVFARNNKKRSHTQLDSRKQVIAFQDRVITINIKEAQHPLKREKQVIDKSSIMSKISTKSMHRVLV